ncbi:MAG: hypothetical protein OFPI_03670 [Osedax symbiont Rs2]|nr:MAG: hypothetical protein OFPI_03670 [Osedax symbiont Rs2]
MAASRQYYYCLLNVFVERRKVSELFFMAVFTVIKLFKN